QAIYPTLEVRGSLVLPGSLRAASYPATIHLTAEDIASIQTGAYVTKVIYLENPEIARPIATRPEEPVEITVRPLEDPVAEARAAGRPVLIVRFGSRMVSDQELAAHAIAGTILMPGDKSLGRPAVPPLIPWSCWPVCDPIAGCRLSEEECL